MEVNMYEFNKANMAQIKPLDTLWLIGKCNSIAKEIYEKGHYWMLLCRERNDYTLFNINGSKDDKQLGSDIRECLMNRGYIIDLTTREDGSYEIWIRDKETEENFVYYLFDYTNAVIEV